jgi:hypothetical protein
MELNVLRRFILFYSAPLQFRYINVLALRFKFGTVTKDTQYERKHALYHGVKLCIEVRAQYLCVK